MLTVFELIQLIIFLAIVGVGFILVFSVCATIVKFRFIEYKKDLDAFTRTIRITQEDLDKLNDEINKESNYDN